MSRRLALVTGAGGGIGIGVALLLRRRGYDLIAVDITTEAAEVAARRIGAGTIPVACDASSPEDVAALAGRIRGEWADELEVLVCNAGVIVPGDVVDTAPRDLRTQIDVMLTAPIEFLAAAAAVMSARGRGHLLATVSMGGVLALPGSAAYSAAKSGLRAFLAAIAPELDDAGVKVSGIYPAGVDTAMLRHEAQHGGSMLNFVGKILRVDEVVAGYEKALDTGRLEVFLPRMDSVVARLLAWSPQIGNRFLPAMERSGARGHARYLARIPMADGEVTPRPATTSAR